MPKKINEGVVEKILTKILTRMVSGVKSAEIEKLKKKDPEFAKSAQTMEKYIKKMEKNLKKKGKSEKEAWEDLKKKYGY